MKRLVLPLFVVSLAGCATRKAVDWSKYSSPAGSNPEIHGTYSAGCLAGARALPLQSPHYYVMNSSRNRFHGHPELVGFVQTMSAEIYKRKLGLSLIGDLSQVRGGPMLSGHNSHQIGLDVDVWFRRVSEAEKKQLSPEQIDRLELLYLAENDRMTKEWNESYLEVLKLVAENEKVERIFVNPAIKREICGTHGGQTWLRKLRPWWGHDEHFHVRLACPKDSPTCQAQAPPDEGDGCGDDLAWWFSAEAKEEAAKRGQTPRTDPRLPEACYGLSEQPETTVFATAD